MKNLTKNDFLKFTLLIFFVTVCFAVIVCDPESSTNIGDEFSDLPDTPSNLTAVPISSSQIYLTWSDNSNNESGFKIERAFDSQGTPASFKDIITLSIDSKSYRDKNNGMNAGTLYHYRVRAYNDAGNSNYSNQAKATTLEDTQSLPVPPDNLSATAFSSSQININWSDNSNSETGFKVERAEDQEGIPGSFDEIATVVTNIESYNDSNNGNGLEPLTTYHYRVRAYNDTGNSNYSNQAKATTKESFEKYEPADGRVLHGIGQYVSFYYTDEENWQYVEDYQDAVDVPLIYSVYQNIDPDVDALNTTDLMDIVQNHNYPYILLVGLDLLDFHIEPPMDSTANPSAILNGDWDNTIRLIAARIKSVDAPVFVRPGFEFGAPDGYHENFSAEDFIAIWNYIVTIFEDETVDNAAWVWNTVNSWQFNYMDYYPGDEAVDWWGINYFTTGQIQNSNAFVEDALIHGKPVMICESCPILNNGTENSENWNNWFVPYFNKRKEYSHIKAFIYISDPWDKSGFFGSWSNSCINSSVTDETILLNYILEMQDSCYVHMDEYQSNPDILNP